MIREGTVYLVGAGPGDPGLMTLRGLEILKAADVVVYDRLANDSLLVEARSDARLIYVGKEAGKHALSQAETNQLLAEEAAAGCSVCRLKGGDPYLFGRGGEEALYLQERGIPFVVVPGVSSAAAAPAYAGIPVTDRRFGSSVAITTGHKAEGKSHDPVRWDLLAQAVDTIVVLMGMANLDVITSELIAGGRDAETPAAVIRWGTTGRQRVVVSDLASISAEVKRARLKPPAILVVGEVVRLREQLSWFERRPLLGLRVLVTRPRHQASALAELLREHGAEPIVRSLVRIEPMEAEVARLQTLFEARWDWALFTSANAIPCFGEQLRAAGMDWRALAGARLGAIGPGTAVALEALGLRIDFVPTRAMAESLAEELPDISPSTRILIPRAAEAREAVIGGLRARGAVVEEVPVYRTVADERSSSEIAELLRSGDIDVVTFTSSSALRAMVDAVGAEALTKHAVACIGPITAQTARDLGVAVDVEAEEHTIPGLVAALTSFAVSRSQEQGAVS
jgi:uroporphyrinogen III methyltransferase/synthase